MSLQVTVVRPSVLMPDFNMANLVVPPIGPAYVAAAIRQAGHHVTFIDSVGLAIEQYTRPPGDGLLHGLTIDETVARIPSEAQCIGVSIQFSYEWPFCRELVRAIRRTFPDALLIAGGEHATAVPDFCLKESPLDVVVLGEGESTVCEVLRAYEMAGREGLHNVPGIWYRDSQGPLRQTPPANRISDLGTIARPAWDLVPVNEYLSRGFGFGVDRGHSMPVLASRGCPYQCTFCSNPGMWTQRWKARDPLDLLDEIADLQKRYQVTNIDFYDLTMIIEKKTIVDFCHAIEQRGMRFTWQLPSSTRCEALDEEVSALLYRTGCRNVGYAPESGSETVLQRVKKKVSLPALMRSLRGSIRNGLNVKCNLIFGFPEDRWVDILASFWALIRFAIIGVHDLSIWVFVPYPGSALFNQLRSQGKIPELNDEYFYRLAAYADITQTFSYCEKIGKRGLLVSRSIGTILFYAISWLVRPWRVISLIKNAVTGHMESRSELALRGFFKRRRKLLATP